MLHRVSPLTSAVVSLALGVAFATVVAAQSPQPATTPGFAFGAVDGLLLLKNGQLLKGTITRSGDYYHVVTDNTELQVRVREAEAICRDLDEVFARKAALVNMRSVEDHLELAEWSIDHNLYGHAARALTEAYRVDDTHPRCALLERRLKAAMAAPREIPAPPKPVAPTIDDAQLDAAVRSISAESLHEFTVRVQPLLMNYCATAGCHGPRGDEKFPLQRAFLNERNDPRNVKLNLHEVLKHVDRQTPSTSRLLTVPISPHGGAKRAVFHAHNAEHYRTIAAWVGRVSLNSRATAGGTKATTGNGTLSQRLPIAPPTAKAELPSSIVAAPSTTSAPGTTASPTAVAVPSVPATAPVTTGSPSADPFDPAEFNRGRTSPTIAPVEPTPLSPASESP
jgi:hypothetical protein